MIGSHKLTLRFPGEWSRPPVDVAMAMVCFAMITAEYVGGKAARDALYLAHLDVTTLPAMVIATSVTSIFLVIVSGRISTRVAASRFVPALFVVSAALLLVEWILTYQFPQIAAIVVYLQISGLGPLLGSSFWIIASDCFDPRTAKRRFGQIQGAGTLGGLIGGGIAFEVAALLDYVFKVEAKNVVRGDGLLRFFSIYYAAGSLITFILQTSASRYALERLGLALTAAAPALAVIGGSLASFVAPGIKSLTLARGGENVLRGSFFKAGYELFYTPIPSVEKRAVKPIIDVAFDRLGDAVGAGAVQLVLLLLPARQRVAILSLATVCSLAALTLTTRLRRGYIHTLERSLLDKALEIDLADVEDLT